MIQQFKIYCKRLIVKERESSHYANKEQASEISKKSNSGKGNMEHMVHATDAKYV